MGRDQALHLQAHRFVIDPAPLAGTGYSVQTEDQARGDNPQPDAATVGRSVGGNAWTMHGGSFLVRDASRAVC